MDKVLLVILPSLLLSIIYGVALIINLRIRLKNKKEYNELDYDMQRLFDNNLKDKKFGSTRFVARATGILFMIGLTFILISIIIIMSLGLVISYYPVHIGIILFGLFILVITISTALRLIRLVKIENNKDKK